MKLHLGLLALYAAHEVAGGALFGGALTSQQLIEELIQRPNLLSENSRWTSCSVKQLLTVQAGACSTLEFKN
jgi:hypothetical protein